MITLEPPQVALRIQAPGQTLQVSGQKEKKGTKDKTRKKGYTKADISQPRNFKHIGKI